MTVQIKNIELNFSDLLSAIKTFTAEQRQQLFEAVVLFKNTSNGYTDKTAIEADSFEAVLLTNDDLEPHPFVVNLNDDVPLEEQLALFWQKREPTDWHKIEEIAASFDWTEDDEVAFRNIIK